MAWKVGALAGVGLLLFATRTWAVTYDVTFTSTDGAGSGGPSSGTITLADADVAAESTTPMVDSFSARMFTFSGDAANATYDAGGNLYSIGLSDSNSIHTLVLHGGATAPAAAAWDLYDVQVPLQKDDFGTYALTLVPEPSVGLLPLAGLALLGRKRGRVR